MRSPLVAPRFRLVLEVDRRVAAGFDTRRVSEHSTANFALQSGAALSLGLVAPSIVTSRGAPSASVVRIAIISVWGTIAVGMAYRRIRTGLRRTLTTRTYLFCLGFLASRGTARRNDLRYEPSRRTSSASPENRSEYSQWYVLRPSVCDFHETANSESGLLSPGLVTIDATTHSRSRLPVIAARRANLNERTTASRTNRSSRLVVGSNSFGKMRPDDRSQGRDSIRTGSPLRGPVA